jgi:hypothetical protein
LGHGNKEAVFLLQIQFFSEVDKIASVKPEGFEKGQQIRRIPSHRRIDIFYALELAIFESFFRQSFADPLPHEPGMDPQKGYPCTAFDAEKTRKNGDNQISNDLALQFRHKTGVFGSPGLIHDHVLEIIFRGNIGDGYADPVDIIGIFRP